MKDLKKMKHNLFATSLILGAITFGGGKSCHGATA